MGGSQPAGLVWAGCLRRDETSRAEGRALRPWADLQVALVLSGNALTDTRKVFSSYIIMSGLVAVQSGLHDRDYLVLEQISLCIHSAVQKYLLRENCKWYCAKYEYS